jgi:serine/threonine protein phosphatase 1
MNSKLLRLPLDTNKRHFVVADIHGMYSEFLELLAKAKYDPANDIIYSVGDLIDRGPDSVEVVQFFTENLYPDVHVCLGNHEYMSMTPMWMATWMYNGGAETIDSLKAHDKDEHWLRDQIADLPWIIEVGDIDDENCFRIVHADYEIHLADHHAEEALDLAWDGDFFDGENFNVQAFLWSRETITWGQHNVKCMKPIHYEMEFNPDRKRQNFVGHSGVKKVLRIGDITFLDTMWTGQKLSMMEVLSREIFSVEV